MTTANDRDRPRVLDAMRSGEWLRTQWIVRVAFALGADGDYRPFIGRTRRVLIALEREGRVQRRRAEEIRGGAIDAVVVRFAIPRVEWRLTPSGEQRQG